MTGDKGLRSNTIIIGYVLADDVAMLLQKNPDMAAAFETMIVTRARHPGRLPNHWPN